MKKIAKWFVDFVGAIVSVYGAMMIAMNAVTMYYMFNGTIQSGENLRLFDVVPDFLHVALMIVTGVFLLAAGYKGPKYFAAWLGFDNSQPPA